MIVSGEIESSQVDAWNRWYDEVHLPEILACPGFANARRYVRDDAEAHHFVTVYELDRADAMESSEFDRARGLGPFGGCASTQSTLYRLHTTAARPVQGTTA